jgi:hypothetical protein
MYSHIHDIDNVIVNFTIGSSPLINIFTYLMLSIPYYKKEHSNTDNSRFIMILFIIPILNGILSAFLYYILRGIPKKYENIYLRFIISGSISQLIIHFLFNMFFSISYSLSTYINIYILDFIIYFVCGTKLRTILLHGPSLIPLSQNFIPYNFN